MKKPIKDFEVMLFKSERDFKSGNILLDGEMEEQAIYHFQQAGEKALKSFLIFHKKKLTKTHDLTNLLEKCIEINSCFEEFYDSAEILTPYATIFRYMDVGYGLIPDRELVEEAKESAEKILNFIKLKLKDEQ